jgi:hypothetical protein
MRWTILAVLAYTFLSGMTATQNCPDTDGFHRDELLPRT